MSKYTTQLRFICESVAGLRQSTGYLNVGDVIQQAIPELMPDYPIFDEEYRNVLNSKILRHYYTREIGFETVGLWRFKLETKLNEIMPYYNQLYESQLHEFNPFYDTQFTRQYEKTGDGTENETGNTTGNIDNTTSGKSDSTSNLTQNNTSKTIGENSGKTATTGEGNESGTDRNVTDRKTNATTDTNGGEARVDDNLHKDAYQDTPQGWLDGGDAVSGNIVDDNSSNLNQLQWLTNYRRIRDTNDSKIDRDEHVTADGSENTQVEGENSRNYSSSGNSTSTMNSTVNVTGNNTAEQTIGTTNSSTGNVTSKGTSERDKKLTSTEKYLESVQGKTGQQSYSSLLMEYRQTFLNIDMQVINELSDLFMGIW